MDYTELLYGAYGYHQLDESDPEERELERELAASPDEQVLDRHIRKLLRASNLTGAGRALRRYTEGVTAESSWQELVKVMDKLRSHGYTAYYFFTPSDVYEHFGARLVVGYVGQDVDVAIRTSVFRDVVRVFTRPWKRQFDLYKIGPHLGWKLHFLPVPIDKLPDVYRRALRPPFVPF